MRMNAFQESEWAEEVIAIGKEEIQGTFGVMRKCSVPCCDSFLKPFIFYQNQTNITFQIGEFIVYKLYHNKSYKNRTKPEFICTPA